MLPRRASTVLLFVAGSFAFIVMTAVLFLGRCTSNEFMFSCASGRGSATAIVIGTAVALGMAAIVSGAARKFGSGFAGTFLALTILTNGGCTLPWFDPYYWYLQRTAAARMQQAARIQRQIRQRAWIEAIDARPMDVTRAVEVAASVMQCAQVMFEQRGSFPATEAELANAECPNARDYRASIPTDDARYVIPSRETRGDAGWRITYAPARDGFAIDVAPDAMLAHKWPRLHATSNGRVEVTMTAAASPVPVSPIEDLVGLVSCLKEIPAEEERRRVNRVLGGWFLTSMARRLCPPLASRLKPAMPNDEYTTELSLVMRAPDGRSVTLVIYSVRFVSREGANGSFGFDLHAAATIGGLPRYLATFEGPVHATTAFRDAATTDAVVVR